MFETLATPGNADPAPAVSTSAPRSTPVFMVVVVEYADAAQLAIAAAEAHQTGARLLIALARTRPGLTTDAVIAGRIAVRANEELRRLEQIARRVLLCSGVNYDIVPMTYRHSRSPDKRKRAIATAASRLARRCGAVPLPSLASGVRPPSNPKTTSLAPQPHNWESGQPAHVVAVLPDSAEAVSVAQAAGELAVASGRPLALVVPVPSTGFTLEPGVLAIRFSRIEQDTAAIAGRVLPTLDRLGLSAQIFSAPYGTDGTARRLSRGMAGATEQVARRLRAEAIVISASFPALSDMRIPAEVLHLVAPVAEGTSHSLARPARTEARPEHNMGEGRLTRRPRGVEATKTGEGTVA